MTGFRTHGYDIAFEIREAIVSGFIGAALPGILSGQGGEIDDDVASGSYSFIDPLTAGTVSLDAPGDDTSYLDIPFRYSATFNDPSDWPDNVDVSGRLTVLAPVIVINSTPTTVQAAFDLSGLQLDDIEVATDNPLPSGWIPYSDPLLRLIKRTVQEILVAQNQFAVPLPLQVDPANDGSDPFMPRDADIRVVRDGGTRSVVLLFRTSPNTEGDASAVTQTTLGATWNAVCIIGNEMLLRRNVGAGLLEELGGYDPAAPDPIVTLNSLLSYADNRVTLSSDVDVTHLVDEWYLPKADLRDLVIEIDESETLDVTGRIQAGGPFVTAIVDLHMTATMDAANPAQIVLHWHIDEPEVVIIPGPLTFMIVGPLAMIISALKGVATDFIFGALENILSSDCSLVGLTEWPEEPQPVDVDCTITVPWPPLLAFFIDDVVLDDWATAGEPDFPDTTYEWPEPSLEIIGDWLTGDGEFGGGRNRRVTAGVWAKCFTHYTEHTGEFRAMPVGPVVYPLDYEWCLGGHALRGSGTLRLGESAIHYDADGDRLSLSLELGDSLDSELCLSAIDARGTELFARRMVSIKGEEEFCSFEGIELLEGPPPELHQVGSLVAELGLLDSVSAVTDEIDRPDYNVMLREAFVRGMDIDPDDPSVRRP